MANKEKELTVVRQSEEDPFAGFDDPLLWLAGEIPFVVPHHWQVFQLTPPEGLLTTPNTRIGFYRLQRNNGVALSGPMLVDVQKGEQAQAKIVYDAVPLAYIERPTEAERATLLNVFKRVADELNEDERDGGLYDEGQARTRAAAIVRQHLPAGLRNDWKDEM